MMRDTMMFSTGDDQEKDVPRWLLRLLAGAKFFSWCKTHRSKQLKYYCRVCMLALCKDCKKQHDGSEHEIITVYKASRMASLRMDDLKRLWDISGICLYTINNRPVTFIYKKRTGISCSRSKNNGAECESCLYGLMLASAKYCSVECKVEAELKTNGRGSMDEKAKRKLETIVEEVADDVHSFRKRARKQQKPQRAPSH